MRLQLQHCSRQVGIHGHVWSGDFEYLIQVRWPDPEANRDDKEAWFAVECVYRTKYKPDESKLLDILCTLSCDLTERAVMSCGALQDLSIVVISTDKRVEDFQSALDQAQGVTK